MASSNGRHEGPRLDAPAVDPLRDARGRAAFEAWAANQRGGVPSGPPTEREREVYRIFEDAREV